MDSDRNAGGGRAPVIMALLSLYAIWGSTYLAIRLALQGFPPILMAGIRFLAAGGGFYIFLRGIGRPAPKRGQWARSAAVGLLLLGGGTGGVTVAEQWVASGLAALAVSAVPVWAVLFSALWGQKPTRKEWAGVLLGLSGVAFLNLEGDFRASPQGAAVLVLAAMSWSFGSVWSRRLDLPPGPMCAAAQMLVAGTFMTGAGLIIGERITAVPSWQAIGALLYLTVCGSVIGFSAYLFLLSRVRPALATSYAYVNPLVAVILGIGLGGERITAVGVAAMVAILAAVLLVAAGRDKW